MTLALLRAKNAIKRKLQAQGIKLNSVSARDITLMAEHHLNKHRARVSTDGQTLDAQNAALREAGAERVFSEKQSGGRGHVDRCQARPASTLHS